MASGTVNFTTVKKFKDQIMKLASDHQYSLTEIDETIAKRRLQQAYYEIESRLMARGLTDVQISTWKRGEEYQLDIATYWYAKASGWGGKLRDEVDWTKVFDRREELDDVAVVSNDEDLLLKSESVAVGMDLMTINKELGYDS